MFAVLNDVIEFDTFLQKSNDQVLLIKISASWCMPCKKIQKEIDKLLTEAKTYDKQKLIVLEIDIEKIPALVEKTKITEFKVRSIPSLFVFHHGKLKKSNQDYWKIREKFPHLTPLEQLKEFIKI
jgi:thioredoxin-like negative regulator of GroEL